MLVEELLSNYTIPELRVLASKLSSDASQKQDELQKLVGKCDKYHYY